MRAPFLLLAVLVVASSAAALSSPVSGGVLCAAFAPLKPGAPTPAPDPVPATLTAVGALTGSCPAGQVEAVSAAPACPPPPYLGAYVGSYCGPLVPPGIMASCMFAREKTAASFFVAGYDRDADGRLTAADGALFATGPTWPPSVAVPHLDPAMGRVIALAAGVGPGAVSLTQASAMVCV